MRNKITVICTALFLILSGCGSASSAGGDEGKKITDAFGSYQSSVENQSDSTSWKADLSCSYTMSYSDDTKDTFDFDASIEKEKENAYFTQKINSNGASFNMEGYYLDGRLYNSYNGISYYEDMSYDDFLKTMMIPFDALSLSDDQIDSITGMEMEDGTVSYVINMENKAAAELFTGRYDVYGLAEYDD